MGGRLLPQPRGPGSPPDTEVKGGCLWVYRLNAALGPICTMGTLDSEASGAGWEHETTRSLIPGTPRPGREEGWPPRTIQPDPPPHCPPPPPLV